MKRIKENAIANQKKIIAELRENNSSESSIEKSILELNLMVDDYEKDNNVVDKENIHLYYNFMSDEDLKKILNWSILSNVFSNRIIYITDIFGWRDNKKVLKLEYWKAFDKYYVKNNDYTRFSFFGIMDTLNPIDEYISDIKNSDAFKEFERDKLLQESIDISNVVIIDFSEDEITEYIDRCIKYLNKRFGPKYIIKIWETDEVYGQRNDEEDYSEEYQGHLMYQGKIASFDGVFENDIKVTSTYCEISAVFSDLLLFLEIIEKETITKVS
ncbi:hypothetical protein ACOL3H_11960 [Aliarcobacter butzleri]